MGLWGEGRFILNNLQQKYCMIISRCSYFLLLKNGTMLLGKFGYILALHPKVDISSLKSATEHILRTSLSNTFRSLQKVPGN